MQHSHQRVTPFYQAYRSIKFLPSLGLGGFHHEQHWLSSLKDPLFHLYYTLYIRHPLCSRLSISTWYHFISLCSGKRWWDWFQSCSRPHASKKAHWPLNMWRCLKQTHVFFICFLCQACVVPSGAGYKARHLRNCMDLFKHSIYGPIHQPQCLPKSPINKFPSSKRFEGP